MTSIEFPSKWRKKCQHVTVDYLLQICQLLLIFGSCQEAKINLRLREICLKTLMRLQILIVRFLDLLVLSHTFALGSYKRSN